MNYLLHMIPGRLRIKVPLIYNNPENATKLRSFLESLKGVEKVICNPITGSVVIHYDCDLTSSNNLIKCLQDYGYINTESNNRENLFGDGQDSKALSFMTRVFFNVALDMALRNTPLSFLTILV